MSSADTPHDLLDKLTRFYRNYYWDEIGELLNNYPKEQESLRIDYTDLHSFCKGGSLQQFPEEALNSRDKLAYLEEALVQVDKPVDIDLSDANVRLYNLPDHHTTSVRGIRKDDLGKLIEVKGIVREATDVLPKLQTAAYECQRCGTLTRIPQSGRYMQEPHQCQGCERQGPFDISIQQSELADSQTLELQENPENISGGNGTPQDIQVNVESDLTGEITAGEAVKIVGWLEAESQSGGGNEKSRQMDIYLDGHSLTPEEEKFGDMEITSEQREEIKELVAYYLSDESDMTIYEAWRRSIAPAIFGEEHDKIKDTVALQLASGVTKYPSEGSRIRGQIHMLVIGEPGTGKSQTIQYIKNIAPRAVTATGKQASSAGLTATAVQKDFGSGSEWTLQAGTLVLADGGIAAVDELDKMSDSDRSSLHEALEQGHVNIAKAGISSTLPAACSLVSAANPKYGRFEEYDPISEQIDMAPALISRFDLIFTLKDKPDKQKDGELADHILKMNHIAQRKTREGQNLSISDSVDFDNDDAEPEIPNDVMRRYIAHIHQNVYPEITPEAKAELQNFYVEMRDSPDDEGVIPVTARKLEALVRLGEASARIRLSETIEKSDAKRVINLVKSSMEDVGRDPETGDFDADMIEAGTSNSRRERIKNISKKIEQLEEEHDEGAPMEELEEWADDIGMAESKFEHEMGQLRHKGDIYEPKNGYIRIT